MPSSATQESMMKSFSPFGVVEYVSIPKFHSGENKGFAFLEYTTPEEAYHCLEVNFMQENRKSIEMRKTKHPNGVFFKVCQKLLQVSILLKLQQVQILFKFPTSEKGQQYLRDFGTQNEDI